MDGSIFPKLGFDDSGFRESPVFAGLNALSRVRAFPFAYLRIYVFTYLRFCVVFHASGGSLRWGVGLYILDETLRYSPS